MKKVILFVMMCVCALSAYALENAKCYLEHEGNVTTFDASKIADAIEAAVKGDILYLGEGQYPGFTLNKEITVRGVGADKTKVSSSVTIAIPGTPEITQDLLFGFSFTDLYLTSKMSNVSIKKCSFSSFNISADNTDILIDRCRISGTFYFESYIKSLSVNNSKIGQIYTYYASYSGSYHRPDDNVSTFVNCNIRSLYNYDEGMIKGTFINCIIKEREYSSSSNSQGNGYSFGHCIFANCLFAWNIVLSNTSTKQECYVDNNFTMENMECSYDTETLTTKGYLGNDGTVVGIYGGSNPFTLDLNLPRITTSKIALDRENKGLNVNLKVTKN